MGLLMDAARLRTATSATFLVFALNGLVFASWAARIPAASARLGLSSGATGALLLFGAVGSVLALPLAGAVVHRVGTANTVRTGGVVVGLGAVGLSLALMAASVPGAAAGLFLFGIGVALWDVSMNIEGAEVERRQRRTIMPQFHAAFSGGAFVGALVGAALAIAGVDLALHLLVISVLVTAAALRVPVYFLPGTPPTILHGIGPDSVPEAAPGTLAKTPAESMAAAPVAPPAKGADADMAGAAPGGTGTRPARDRFAAWRESRTLVIGLVVLGAALTEGAANDWIAKASVDGLGTSGAGGAGLFAVFVLAMTGFRFFGGRLIDRYGRVPVLRLCMGSALAGLLLFCLAPMVWLAAIGAVFWGVGAALGFPIGMSAAADEPAHAAARVSVVSTIGYTAFLAGPPLLGFLGDHVGIRHALLAVGLVVVASLLTAPAARPLRSGRTGRAA